MRKHGWKLPYHPLQVVAIAVFLALGFAFYVFFAPFVGKKMFQYIVMGIYTPLIVSAFSLYIWCAAADPADPGVFKSKKYLKIPETGKNIIPKDSKLSGDCTASLNDASAAVSGGKHVTEDLLEKDAASICSTVDFERKISSERPSCFLLARSPCAFICNCFGSSKESSIQQMSEEGMFYCNLCEVEVFKYSKHCRVCDKCVDSFDHHCRWLNNCIGKRNYRQFFTLMVASLLLLILQWTTGILVLVCCFLERKQFSVEISAKLGSSFSLVPFVVVVAVCTLLAMIATLPIVQLIFFHILLIKKGISTYDYIVALREQEQEQEQQGVGVQQSPQMSPASSLTGLSSASSFTNFHRGAWCTPQRLFLEDQFDVVPPETGSVSSFGKKVTREEPTKKKNPGAVKISPWTLARLNAEEVSKAAAEARKRSKILQPVARHDGSFGIENEGSFGSSRHRMFSKPENNRKRGSKRVRLPADLPMEPLAKVSSKAIEKDFTDTSSSLAPLQLEAQNAFQTNQVISRSMGIVASSPESSLDSPDIHPFGLSSSKAEETRWLSGLAGLAAESRFPLSRSTSDGYEASGGEDSDRVPSRMTQRTTNWSNGGEDSDRVSSRMTQRTTNWSNVLFRSDRDERIMKLKASSSTEKAMIN